LRNQVFGAIGVVWGGLILLRAFLVGLPGGSGAYRHGHIAGLLFAALLVLVGGYFVLNGKRPAREPPPRDLH
jgi:hypothetical protein